MSAVGKTKLYGMRKLEDNKNDEVVGTSSLRGNGESFAADDDYWQERRRLPINPDVTGTFAYLRLS